MTTNRKLEIVAGLGVIVAGLATGGVLPATAGTIGLAISGIAALFREKPETKKTKVRKAKETLGIQVADAEEPR